MSSTLLSARLQVYALTHIAQLLAIDPQATEEVQAAQAGVCKSLACWSKAAILCFSFSCK